MLSRELLLYAIVLFFSLTIQDSSSVNLRSNVGLSVRDSELNFSQLARKYGYYTEKHPVTTEDGYILTNFRMRARQCEGKRPPVLVMHGFLLSSDCFLDAGPGIGLAYLLADACYDVWVGNYRGNEYSRAHTTLNPDTDAQFWKFSYDQMGYYDVPAIIDYILNQTGVEKLNFIGHSQGAGTAFIMLSERPEYNNKISVLAALAPSTRHTNTRPGVFKSSCIFLNKYERALEAFGINELMGKSKTSKLFISLFCQLDSITEAVCLSALSITDSYHPRSITHDTAMTLFGHISGSSVHNMAQFGQAMLCDDFLKFDYGADNIKIYGSKNPPSYNLGATTVPVVLIYGENDHLVVPEDVEWLASKLSNVLESYPVPDPKWNHLDFAYSQFIPKLVLPKILQYLDYYN